MRLHRTHSLSQRCGMGRCPSHAGAARISPASACWCGMAQASHAAVSDRVSLRPSSPLPPAHTRSTSLHVHHMPLHADVADPGRARARDLSAPLAALPPVMHGSMAACCGWMRGIPLRRRACACCGRAARRSPRAAALQPAPLRRPAGGRAHRRSVQCSAGAAGVGQHTHHNMVDHAGQARSP